MNWMNCNPAEESQQSPDNINEHSQGLSSSTVSTLPPTLWASVSVSFPDITNSLG